jgi:hypothetical protein
MDKSVQRVVGIVAALLCGAGFVEPAAAIDLRARTTSSSKQFTIYCEDVSLRGRVAGFVEDVKVEVYSMLGQAAWGRIPIVVTIEPGEAPTPARVQLAQTPDGPTIQIKVKIGSDPAAVHLEKQIVRALLLDFMYRDRPQPNAGALYAEAPWWVVSGIIESNRKRGEGVETDLFRRLIDTNKLPPIAVFVTGHGDELGPTAEAFDSACAMALIQLLLEQPEGKSRLARLVRGWPDSYDNPIAALNRAFPQLGDGPSGLQKWWTVNLARFAASNRYRGLSSEDTERQLAQLLEFDVTTDKSGTREHFTLGQFRDYIKMPGVREIMQQQREEVLKLGSQANALLLPVVQGYEQIFFLLGRGKTRGIAERIHQIETYRNTVLHRKSEIADFLNWFEATQLGMRSDAFDSYLQAAQTIERDRSPTAASVEIAKYLDLLQEEFKPVRPR